MKYQDGVKYFDIDVVLFLFEQNLPYDGSTTKLGNPSNGLFFGNLELLSSRNHILKSHLEEGKNHQTWKKLNEQFTIASLLMVPQTFLTLNR